MIVQQSLATALAKRPIGNQKPVISSPSPGGEGWGEGELNRYGLMSALTGIPAPDYWILNFSVSSLLKANQAFPRLLKPFFKNPFLFPIPSLDRGLGTSRLPAIFYFPSSILAFGSASLCQPTPGYASLCQLPPGGQVHEP
jgi:hypothetical protein